MEGTVSDDLKFLLQVTCRVIIPDKEPPEATQLKAHWV
jgi:hypothetical protein